MLDQKLIANIRNSGIVQGTAQEPKRTQLLCEEFGFRVADKAEYAVIASCSLPFSQPQAMKALSFLLQHFKLDYTLLPREYCCGLPLFMQAIRNKSEPDLNEAHLLAKEFLDDNLRQVREVGATKIIVFCAGCEVLYSRFAEAIPQEALWYPALLARIFRGGKLDLEADYYAGCYYLHRRLCSAPTDLDSQLRILNSIEGLKLNHLNHQLCCTRPQEAEELVASIKSRTVITACADCARRLKNLLQDKGDYKVIFLPEIVAAAVKGDSL
ncbi:heterodisulfide reductase-related iron-sulfur binding cluster [Chloroflexota bacterium]